tara:strand:+ start:433 stop:1104 length:672 start_codon:yes stop_codon:yes gene_type:complete
MSRIRIGIISPVDVAFPAVREAFTVLWPEASSVCLLDESLYADFVNPDFSVSPEYPDEAYTRIAELFNYSKSTGADGIIFCGSVFGPLVEKGRMGFDIPILTSFEAMIEEGLKHGPRLGIVTSTQSSLGFLTNDIIRYTDERSLDVSIKSQVAEGAFQKILDGDIEGSDSLIIEAAQKVTECDSLMLGQFSMGRVVKKIPTMAKRPILTAPECAVKKLKSIFQ